jgi:rod shape determining protein RodA
MKPSAWRTIDWSLYILPILLVLIGIATIYSTTLGTNKAYLVTNQIVSTLLGLTLMVVFSLYDYRNFRNLSRVMYIVTTLLLILVFFFGKKVLGATRWIDLGIIQLQPSELAKVGLLFYVSTIICCDVKRWSRDILWIILISFVPLILVISQPDLGTAITTIIMIFSLYFTWSIPRKFKIITLILILMLAPIVWLSLREYQKERIRTFANPGHDPRGAGYNVIQSMIAVGSGGIYGRGLGNGPQSQLNFLPVAQTDFIFAGWSEAAGFVGAMSLVILELLLCWRIYRIAAMARDIFGRLVAIGFSTMLLTQTIINVGMNIGLAPVTGIPLPFVSYGGTALLISFLLVGVMQSIHIRYQRGNSL